MNINKININTLSSESLTKIVSKFLMGAVRLHKIQNIGFFVDDDDTLYTGPVDGTDVEEHTDCVYIINLSSIEIRDVEHLFPDGFSSSDLAIFTHKIYDRFPVIEEELSEALSVLKEANWTSDEYFSNRAKEDDEVYADD